MHAVDPRRVLEAGLVRTDPRDTSVLLASAAALVLVTLLAALLPSARATRIDPMEALRG